MEDHMVIVAIAADGAAIRGLVIEQDGELVILEVAD